jgi:hypothetical protein
MANRFDDISGLVGYWSATESTLDTTGSVVNSVSSVYGSGIPGSGTQITLTASGADTTLVSDAVSAMPGLKSAGAGASSMLAYVLSPVMDVSTAGYTLAVAYNVTSNGGANQFIAGTSRAGNTIGTYLRSDGGFDNISINGNTSNGYEPATANAVTRYIISAGPASGTGKIMHDGVLQRDNTTSAATSDIERIALLNRAYVDVPTNGAFDGAVAIACLYNRQITNAEMTEVDDLLQHWLANNAPPSTTPTTDSFGPVSTNQDGAVETWAWEESSNGSDWGPVGTILTDVSGADTNTLTIDRATVAMHQTYVRCRASTASQTTWSDPAQVFIEGEPI